MIIYLVDNLSEFNWNNVNLLPTSYFNEMELWINESVIRELLHIYT